MTDRQTKIIRVQKITNVNSTNQVFLKEAISQIKKKDQGSQALVRACNKVDNLDKLYCKYIKEQKKLPKNK